MRISVIGCGYLGAVHAAGMASIGHEVVGIDVLPERVELLNRGVAPFFEPGLPELLREAHASGRLRFSADPADAAGCRVHFLGVGTPQLDEHGTTDMRQVRAGVEGLLPVLRAGDLVVGKSTVPVGTARELRRIVQAAQAGAELAWNPEFLREGFAVEDTLRPDRIVYGITEEEGAAAWVTALLDEVYAPVLAHGMPRLIMSLETAELVKVAANAFLASKISFINAMAELCEATGADVMALADAIGHDERIGRRFLNAGIGFGGGCLPKDIRAFRARAEELGAGEALEFLRHVDRINLRRRERVLHLAGELLGRDDGDLQGRRVAVLGLAFKPESDDLRDSPALDVARRLAAAGAEVRAYDPAAMEPARMAAPELAFAGSALDALDGAELAILATEWREFRELDPAEAASRAAQAPVIIDARNCLDAAAWRAAGWRYTGLGREHP